MLGARSSNPRLRWNIKRRGPVFATSCFLKGPISGSMLAWGRGIAAHCCGHSSAQRKARYAAQFLPFPALVGCQEDGPQPL